MVSRFEIEWRNEPALAQPSAIDRTLAGDFRDLKYVEAQRSPREGSEGVAHRLWA
jgi:hypothetical protein